LVLIADGDRLQGALPGVRPDLTFEADGTVEYFGGHAAADNLDGTVTPGAFHRYVSVCHVLSFGLNLSTLSVAVFYINSKACLP
jgi:hypothetical protein